MPDINIVGVSAFFVESDTEITTPDGLNTWVARADKNYGVPIAQGDTMEIDPAVKVMCQLSGGYQRDSSGRFLQVITVDEVREAL